jgi:hypothetical protein
MDTKLIKTDIAAMALAGWRKISMLGILRRVMRGVRALLELRMLVERITFMGGFGPWMLGMNFHLGYWDKVVI